MELQRGVCSLCSEGGRVLKSSEGEEFSKLLPEILYENFLPQAEFQKIKSLIKICAVCCYKIQVAAEIKSGLNASKTDEDICYFCSSDKCLIRIDSNWKYFNDRTEGCLESPEFPLCACPRCIFYFDVIFTLKNKLVYKFPQLATLKKKSNETTPQKQNDTPKRKSTSKSPSSSKKRKIFDNCFTYLQPLCNKNYNIDAKLKRDSRMYRKIAYVNLKDAKDVYVKETPKQRPVIKIKLKPRGKKGEKELVCKSEEITSKRGLNKTKRRHSYLDKKEDSEERENNLEETPKSAIVSHPVPKRRVSDYMDNGDRNDKEPEPQEPNEPKEEDKETEPEEKPQEPEEHLEEGDKEDIKEVEGNPEEKEEEQEFTPYSNNVANGEKTEVPPETEIPPDEEPVKNPSESDSSPSSPRKTPPRSESSTESSDSENSDKDKKANSESDVVNGSERKKKRVTFSDEIDI